MNFSSEYDYFSIGASSRWAKDTADKLTTFTLGASANYDTIKPVGGAPEGLTHLSYVSDKEKYKYKKAVDVLLGLTQVLTRKTLLQTNYVFSYKNGYLTDPYKLDVFLEIQVILDM